MEQGFRSLTDRGVSGYKKFSASFCNSQTLAAELFPQNEWQRSIPLGRTPSNKSERPSVHPLSASLAHRSGLCAKDSYRDNGEKKEPLKLPVRDYLFSVLPGLSDLPIQYLPELTPAARIAQHS
jgi:hypothetical protein